MDEAFSGFYGKRYLDPGAVGRRPFPADVARAANKRREQEPDRFPRPIDAAQLNELVDVICKPEMYGKYFKPALEAAFPQGNEVARTFLYRIVEIRNKLSHANPITMQDAIRATCYTQDVATSLKEYYAAMNRENDYNVPMIIKIADSNGNVFHAAKIKRNNTGVGFCHVSDRPSGRLRPGDRISVEVEIDSTFERSSYKLTWVWRGKRPDQFADSERVVVDIEKLHINPAFCIHCRVTSDKDWHRIGDYDDGVAICYTVLPPIS